MTTNQPPARPDCDICNLEMIALRRVTRTGERTTYYCARKDDRNHRETRRLRRFAAHTARIEARIGR